MSKVTTPVVSGLYSGPVTEMAQVDSVEKGTHKRHTNNNNEEKTKVTHWGGKLFRLLVFGLMFYVADIGLHLGIASKYLTMRGCHRGISHTIQDFKLDNLLALSNFTLATTDGPQEPTDLPSKIESLLEKSLYLNLRDKLIKVLPDHWVQRIVDILTFQAGKHRGSDIPNLCRLNGKKFNTLAEMAVYLCGNAFIDTEGRLRASRGLNNLFQDESTEDALVDAMISGNMTRVKRILLRDVLSEGDVKSARLLEGVFERFTKTFNDPEETEALMTLLSDDLIIQNMGPLTEAMGKIDPEHLDRAAKTFAKINADNIPEIDRLLGKLNVTLASFIIDPTIFLQFFGDPEKGKILLEVQQLLPIFDAVDINSILTIKMTFDDIPGADEILGKVLELPMDVLMKIFEVRLSEEELKTLQTAAERVLSSEETKSLLGLATNDLDLLTAQGRSAFASECTHESLQVECIDTSVDLCPYGHLLYGLATVAAMALPGLLFGLSEFAHHRAFRFGGLFGRMLGQEWPLIIKLLILPLYVAIMIPLVVIATIFQYINAAKSIMRTAKATKPQKQSSNSFSPQPQSFKSDEVVKLKVARQQEEIYSAIQLHSLETHGESFFQLCIQLYFLFLLVLMGTGTIVAGVDAESFFNDILPLTVASLLISSLGYGMTSWRLERGDFGSKDLPHPKSTFQRGLTYFLWAGSSHIAHIFSVVALSILCWIEMFSSHLTSTGLTFNIHMLPFLILLASVPVNAFLHRHFVQEDNTYSWAHALLSAVFPARYLHRSDRDKTKMFLISNQLTTWISHILAWLCYCLAIYFLHESEDTGLLRLLPFISAFVSFPPLFGAIHWAVSIDVAYKASGGVDANADVVNPEDEFGACDGKSVNLKGRPLCFYRFWQISTITTRMVSMGLLAYVYHEHWLEVGKSSVRLAVAETVPYLELILLGNVALQFATYGGSLTAGVVAVFLPNGFLQTKRDDAMSSLSGSSTSLTSRSTVASRGGRYIILNMFLNTILQLLLWLVLTFYCWECTKVLSLNKLMYGFPTSILLWILNLGLTGLVWRTVVRPSLEEDQGLNNEEESDAQRPSRIYSMTTQL